MSLLKEQLVMKNNTPIFSVVIPCYNQGIYLSELLSCFPDYNAQNTYEVIFVNDGSTDQNTLKGLDEVEAKGFQVLHQHNQGLCVTRNNGINLARGKYILALDGDDLVSTRFIFEAINIFENNPEYDVVYSDGNFFNGEYFKERTGPWLINARTGPWIIGEYNLQRLMIDNYLPSQAIFRKSAWARVKGFDPDLVGVEDWDFWLSIAFTGGKFFYIKEKLFDYRMLHDSIFHTLTITRYRELCRMLQVKHSDYLGEDLLTDTITSNFKYNKRMWFKLFIKIYFPNYFNKLIAQGKVKTTGLLY